MSNNQLNIECCVSHCDEPLNGDYWNERWIKNEIGWDIGKASPAIVEYLKQYENKNAAILIPGCGNAYEAEFMLNEGFTNITLIDIAPKAVKILKEKFSNNQSINIICEDFFNHQGKYDLIIEQTFFCSITPNKRNDYAKKAASILNENGRIIGLLFDKHFNNPYPPFGGCPCEYKPIFEPYFNIKTMEDCYNSITQRAKSEIFINLIKK